LGQLGGEAFRIGRMGDLNEPMALCPLTAGGMAWTVAGVPHAKGGVNAAMEFYGKQSIHNFL
jgi:alanine-glyoxylate transaminase/serine-glyoxylate transaminase/serine-pyruvate transaminase